MTQTELKNLFRSTLVAQRTIAQEYTALDAIVDFVSQALASGIPEWTALLTFQTDGTDDGTFCIYPDTNGAIRFWKTKTNSNINTAPPTNPLTTETANWIEVSPSDGSSIKEWAPGVFGEGLVIVFYNDGSLRALYQLVEPVRPYESTDIDAEIIAGDWVQIARPSTPLATFTIGNLLPLFTASLGGDELVNPAIAFTPVNKAANLFYAGPATGADAAPTFRAPVDADGIVIKDGATGVKDITFAAQTDTKPPFKLTAGTLLASLTNGAFEYNGTHLYITIGGVRYQIDQQSIISAVASVAEINTGTENAKFSTPLGLAGSKYLDQSGSKIYAAATGTNTYAATISPAITAYAAGQIFLIKFDNANTGIAATINLNALGVKAIKKNVTQQLDAGDIQANQVLLLYYDGTNFQIVAKSETEGTGQTTDGTTWVTIATAALSEDGSYLIDNIWLSGLQNSSKLYAAFYKGNHAVKVVSSALTLVGSLRNDLTFNTGSDAAVRTCLARTNISGTTIQLQVRGVAAITMNWQGGFKLRKYIHP